MSYTEQQAPWLRERRDLLRYLFEAKNVPLVPDTPDTLLDEADVKALINKFRSGRPFDIRDVQRGTNPFVPAAAAGPSGANPFEPAAGSAPDIPVRYSANGTFHVGDGSLARGSADDIPDDSPRLKLEGLDGGGVPDAYLHSLVYLVFLTCTSHQPDKGLLRLMRKQLQISDSRARELHKALGVAVSNGVAARDAVSETLRLPLLMLQHLRPEAFEGFAAFNAWRGTVCAMTSVLFSRACNQWRDVQPGQPMGSVPRQRIARLKACIRRLDVCEDDDYDQEEYEDGLEALMSAADAIARDSGCGYALPFALRIRVCEMLLCGVFEQQGAGCNALSPGSTSLSAAGSSAAAAAAAGATDTFVDEKEDLLDMLQQHVWPALGISRSLHNALYAWIHFRQFAATGNSLLLRPAKRLLQHLLEEQQDREEQQYGSVRSRTLVSPKQGLYNPQEQQQQQDLGAPARSVSEQAEVDLPAAVSAAVVEWIGERMDDYHTAFGANVKLMQGLLELLVLAESYRTGEAAVPALVAGYCKRSVAAEFGRARRDAEAAKPDRVDQLSLLAGATRELLATELNRYGAALGNALPLHQTLVAETLHQEYGVLILPWFESGKGLDLSVVQLVRTAEELEDDLQRAMQEGRLEPWGLSAAIVPLLYDWVGDKLGQLRTWTERLTQKEDWAPVTREQPCGRSAIELVKLAMQSVDSLFEMRLQLPTELVRTLLEGLDASISSYSDFVSTSVGSVDSLSPPCPPLTRFKRELWVKSVDAEAKGKRPPLLDDETLKALAVPGNSLAPLGVQRNVNVTTEALIVRMNCLSYLYDALPTVQQAVQQRWIAEQGSSANLRAKSMELFVGVLTQASRKLEKAMDRMCKYSAYKVVWWDMAKEWTEFLYRWSVDRGRIDVVLQRLDAVLSQLCRSCAESLSEPLARNMLRASCAAYRRVLLDGGATRWFMLEDVPLLEEDLQGMKQFFYAGGDGLTQQEVERYSGEVEGLLRVMSLPTHALIAHFQKANSAFPATGGGDLLANKDVLLRVLCHRADRNASKFLKTDFRIPKKTGKGGGGFSFKKLAG